MLINLFSEIGYVYRKFFYVLLNLTIDDDLERRNFIV